LSDDGLEYGLRATVVIDDGPGSGRIENLHCWVAVSSDGNESLVGRDLPVSGLPGVLRHSPLMSARRQVAESYERLTKRFRQDTMHKDPRIVSVRLVTFTRTDGPRQ
jgi:hypothetical protein